MKRHRHSPEQALRKVREGERLLSEGTELIEVLRHLEISETPRVPRMSSTCPEQASCGVDAWAMTLGNGLVLPLSLFLRVLELPRFQRCDVADLAVEVIAY